MLMILLLIVLAGTLILPAYANSSTKAFSFYTSSGGYAVTSSLSGTSGSAGVDNSSASQVYAYVKLQYTTGTSWVTKATGSAAAGTRVDTSYYSYSSSDGSDALWRGYAYPAASVGATKWCGGTVIVNTE
jgi:hypothetical protein